jgi:DNA processing protein
MNEVNERELAYAYLSRVIEPPEPDLWRLIERFGAVEAAARVSRQDFPEGFEQLVTTTSARADRDRAAADLEHLHRLGGRLLTPDDGDWPGWPLQALAERERGEGTKPEEWIELRPIALWVLGGADLDVLLTRSVAIVGTRAPSGYGEHVTRWFAQDLATADFTVVSGGAYGIDALAHQGALTAGAPTVAFVAGGLDRPYPAGHAGLFRRIIAGGGAVVSEYPPGTVPAKFRFLQRNRLVAGVARAVVVVEAGARSGTHNTARWARSRDIPVLAVPGPVTSATSVGCHQLVQEQKAMLVTRPTEVIEYAGRMGELAPDRPAPVKPTDGLTESQLRVQDAFDTRGEFSVTELARRAGLRPMAVRAALTMLELKELVEPVGGLWRLSRTARSDRPGQP